MSCLRQRWLLSCSFEQCCFNICYHPVTTYEAIRNISLLKLLQSSLGFWSCLRNYQCHLLPCLLSKRNLMPSLPSTQNRPSMSLDLSSYSEGSGARSGPGLLATLLPQALFSSVWAKRAFKSIFWGRLKKEIFTEVATEIARPASYRYKFYSKWESLIIVTLRFNCALRELALLCAPLTTHPEDQILCNVVSSKSHRGKISLSIATQGQGSKIAPLLLAAILCSLHSDLPCFNSIIRPILCQSRPFPNTK